jgi:hypothetical protein
MPAIRSWFREPKFDCTNTPTVNPPSAAGKAREAVPIPPLNSKHLMPVPPPTLPSATDPDRADSSAE